MPVHRRWLVLVFGLLALLCGGAFLTAVVPFNSRSNRQWDLKESILADGSVTVDEFVAHVELTRQGPKIESMMLLVVACGCVVIMFMLLPVWVYSQSPRAMVGGKGQPSK